MLKRSKVLDSIVGCLVALALFGCTWVTLGGHGAIGFWLLLLVADAALIRLLQGKTDGAKLLGFVLMPSAIFLLFLPQSIKKRIAELEKRASQSSFSR